jgi:hypothetical protein
MAPTRYASLSTYNQTKAVPAALGVRVVLAFRQVVEQLMRLDSRLAQIRRRGKHLRYAAGRRVAVRNLLTFRF